MKEALLYEKISDNRVKCSLCNHRCIIQDGSVGLCGVRKNERGILRSLVYDRVVTRNLDPIEKKPLFHFLPGSRSYSIATVGCNLKCSFCQNSDISQMPNDLNRIFGEAVSPEAIVKEAVSGSAATVAYTYTEPTIYFELAYETAKTASAQGLKNVFVSNGYMTEECLNHISGDLHAANIDLKSFSDRFYRDQCGARLEPVLNSIIRMAETGVWLEITTLLIPGLNDSDSELRELARFICNLDSGIPWHISRFHPTYRLNNIKPTPAESIHRAKEIGYSAGLKYVYTGNLPGDSGEKTFCHNCGALLIDRYGFQVRANKIEKGCCPGCMSRIPGIWN